MSIEFEEYKKGEIWRTKSDAFGDHYILVKVASGGEEFNTWLLTPRRSITMPEWTIRPFFRGMEYIFSEARMILREYLKKKISALQDEILDAQAKLHYAYPLLKEENKDVI
jgi:hypothetical protein